MIRPLTKGPKRPWLLRGVCGACPPSNPRSLIVVTKSAAADRYDVWVNLGSRHQELFTGDSSLRWIRFENLNLADVAEGWYDPTCDRQAGRARFRGFWHVDGHDLVAALKAGKSTITVSATNLP